MHADSHVHITEAIKHLKETVKHSDMEHTMTGIYSIETLNRAETAEKAHADAHKHMSEVVKHLKEAETHNNAGHKDKVTEHLNKAIEHIEDTL
jgi:ribosomal protein S20